MENNNDICRVVKHETVDGTFYISQRKVWKCHIPLLRKSGYRWESFCIRNINDPVTNKNYSKFDKLDQSELDNRLFKDIKIAENYCSQWVRTNNTGETVKVWTADSAT